MGFNSNLILESPELETPELETFELEISESPKPPLTLETFKPPSTLDPATVLSDNIPTDYIPIATPNLCGNEAKYLMECVQTNFVSTVGPFVKKFEQELCAVTKANYAVPTCSGTSALHLSLKAVGVKENELVIIPSFTFIATANAIRYCGSDPWIFDISEKDWGLDPELLEKTLLEQTLLEQTVLKQPVLKQTVLKQTADKTLLDKPPLTESEFSQKTLIHIQSGKRVAAIILVCTLGIPPSINEILDVAKKFNIPVILDAAGAIGAKYHGKELGELDIPCTVLSFNGNKLITSGGGGCILFKDADLANRIRHLSTTARRATGYLHDEVGYNYRMTNIAAAVGCAQLENLELFLKQKKFIASKYNQLQTKFKSLNIFPNAKENTPNFWLSGFILPNPNLVNEFIEFMRSFGINAQKFWIPIHKQPPYVNSYCTKQDYVESIYKNIVILPCSSHLTEKQLDSIISVVTDGLIKLNVK